MVKKKKVIKILLEIKSDNNMTQFFFLRSQYFEKEIY